MWQAASRQPHSRPATMSLPYAADAAQALTPAELAVLRNQYEDEAVRGHVAVQTKFNYAWGLVKSSRREDVVEGVNLLASIYREAQSRRRECVYYLALGHFKLGNFEEARRFNSLLLSREPTNLQAQSLGTLIDRGVAKGRCFPSCLPGPGPNQNLRGVHRDGYHCRSSSTGRHLAGQLAASTALTLSA